MGPISTVHELSSREKYRHSRAGIQTRGLWVRSVNATSVLCSLQADRLNVSGLVLVPAPELLHLDHRANGVGPVQPGPAPQHRGQRDPEIGGQEKPEVVS